MLLKERGQVDLSLDPRESVRSHPIFLTEPGQGNLSLDPRESKVQSSDPYRTWSKVLQTIPTERTLFLVVMLHCIYNIHRKNPHKGLF